MYTTKNNYPAKTISSVFDELFNSFPYATQNVVTSKVPVNIYESELGYNLEIVAPGRTKEEFSIKLDQNILTIGAETKEAENKEWKTVRNEYKSSSFKRSFTVDEKINTEGIEAKYENGILKVFLPKKEEVKNAPKQITIN